MTIRPSDTEAAALDRLAVSTGKSRSTLVREALRRLALHHALRTLHDDLEPQARAAGWLNEDGLLRALPQGGASAARATRSDKPKICDVSFSGCRAADPSGEARGHAPSP